MSDLENSGIGTHVIADFWGASHLSDTRVIDAAMRAAVEQSGAQLLSVHLHPFGDGAGVTGVALLAESHISVHTWPEQGYAALDVFMCGSCNPAVAVEVLKHHLQPVKVSLRILTRGIPALSEGDAKSGLGY